MIVNKTYISKWMQTWTVELNHMQICSETLYTWILMSEEIDEKMLAEAEKLSYAWNHEWKNIREYIRFINKEKGLDILTVDKEFQRILKPYTTKKQAFLKFRTKCLKIYLKEYSLKRKWSDEKTKKVGERLLKDASSEELLKQWMTGD